MKVAVIKWTLIYYVSKLSKYEHLKEAERKKLFALVTNRSKIEMYHKETYSFMIRTRDNTP